MAKVVIVISTAEKEKTLTGIKYAVNCLQNGWYDEAKVFFFGPSEALLAHDKDVQIEAARLLSYQVPIACKHIADRHKVTQELTELGYCVDYTGSAISAYVCEGYIPMIF